MSLSIFKTNSMFHSHDTRNKSDLFITSHNTKLFEKSIAYNGVLLYNKQPSEIKSVRLTIKFKKMFINFLLEKSFYAVEEFITTDSSFVGIVLMVYFHIVSSCTLHLCTVLISILCCSVYVCSCVLLVLNACFCCNYCTLIVITLLTCPLSLCNDF
jgi:hypothetical protein